MKPECHSGWLRGKEHHNGSGGIGRILLYLLVLVLLLELVSQGFVNLSAWEDRLGFRTRDSVYTDLGGLDRDSIDVLVLGDSEAFTSFSPLQAFSQSGTAAYVAGMYGENCAELYRVFREALQRQHPKVVLVETHSLYEAVSEEDEERKTLLEGLKNLFPVFRFHNLWQHAFERPGKENRTYRGFRIMTSVRRPKDLDTYMKPDRDLEEFPPPGGKLLRKMAGICDRKGIHLVMYSAPSPKNYSMRRHNALAAAAGELGIPYLDLNLEISAVGIDWNRDCLDGGDHLNISGAARTTSYLQSFLSRFSLPDRRSDPDYASWQTEAQQYEEIASKYIDKIRAA